MKPSKCIMLLAVICWQGLGLSQTPVPSENLFYMVDREESFQSFKSHSDQISIVCPQTYFHEASGVIWGSVDTRVLTIANHQGIKVIPLIVNTGFNQQQFHEFLHDNRARSRAIDQMVAIAKKNGYEGWQFDYENIHIDDRDQFTAYYRETSEAFRKAGLSLSMAVVPRDAEFAGPTRFHRYIQEYWRGGYDLKAIAEIGDFVSLMTYSQHTRFTPPGPIAGYPWVKSLVEYGLKQGIPAEKLSLGVPFYSHHWYPAYSEEKGGHVWADGASFPQVTGLMERFGTDLRWLDDQKVYFAFWEHDGIFEYVFAEEKRSLDAKLDLLQEYGLRGISVWRLGQEDPGVWKVLSDRTNLQK